MYNVLLPKQNDAVHHFWQIYRDEIDFFLTDCHNDYSQTTRQDMQVTEWFSLFPFRYASIWDFISCFCKYIIEFDLPEREIYSTKTKMQ